LTVDLLPWAELATPYTLAIMLMATRIALATMWMPGLSSGRVPDRVRMVVVVVLAIMMSIGLGGVAIPFPEDVFTLGLMLLREALIGGGIGFAVRLVVLSAEVAGSMAGISMGLSLNVLVDPTTGDQSVSLGALLAIGAMMLFVAFNGHDIVIWTLFEHFQHFPVGETTYLAVDPEKLATAFMKTVYTGLQLASPAIVVTLTLNISMAFVSRAVPSVNLFGIGLGLLIMAGWMSLAMEGEAVLLTTEQALHDLPRNMIDFGLQRSGASAPSP
jgi:flagellar biosynthetic protein FliR